MKKADLKPISSEKRLKFKKEGIRRVKKLEEKEKLKWKRKKWKNPAQKEEKKRLEEKYGMDKEEKALLKEKLKIQIIQGKRKVLVRKVYPLAQCKYIYPDGNRCKNLAVGKGTLCGKHGGELNIELENTYDTELTKVMGGLFKIDYHPMQYLQLCKEGLTPVEIAAQFCISVKTLETWAERYKDFALVYEAGKAMTESWWLEKGKSGLDDVRNFNTGLYKFLTGNKLGYSEKTESKNTTTHFGVLVVPPKQSLEEWENAKVVNCIEHNTIDTVNVEK